MKANPKIVAPLSAEDNPVAIAVRAYVQSVEKSKPKPRKRRNRVDKLEASNVVLVFDTETNLDAAQHIRFATYQVRVDGRLDEEGLFFDHKTLSKRDRRILSRYADTCEPDRVPCTSCGAGVSQVAIPYKRP